MNSHVTKELRLTRVQEHIEIFKTFSKPNTWYHFQKLERYNRASKHPDSSVMSMYKVEMIN